MRTRNAFAFAISLLITLAGTLPAFAAQISPQKTFLTNASKSSVAVAFDVSKPVRDMAPASRLSAFSIPFEREVRPERGPVAKDKGFSGDRALQQDSLRFTDLTAHPTISGTLANFDGLSNQDNFNIFGGRVNPPDPVGDVGPNHYVEMINLVFGVYSKTGTLLAGPFDIGSLWQDFPIDECTDPSGDGIVLYDQFADRWILTQFTTRGLGFPAEPLNLFYNCVAISTTGDPTGSYYRYAFTTGYNFPDYPKIGIWKDSYIITTREFGVLDPTIYGIGIYAVERDKMLMGDPNARAQLVFLDSAVVDLNLIGDGLLPPDIDGRFGPIFNDRAPIVGTQDDDASYGATFDAINVWELKVRWRKTPTASVELAAQLPVEGFDSIFPCGVVPSTTPGTPPTSRDCLPQPGITDGSRFLDILSYRQRPTWRLAYRNFFLYEAMVTNQSVEAAPGVAGVRWYELRRNLFGKYSVFQQGTFAPADGVHRWMGSAAMDKFGNMALGYSVVNGADVFPGIRYTGRLRFDPRGQMPLGEGTIVNGTGVQRTTNSRWGDYTSMNVDPTDDCTFWYVNEYYTAEGQASSTAGFQTRIGSFKLPGCR